MSDLMKFARQKQSEEIFNSLIESEVVEQDLAGNYTITANYELTAIAKSGNSYYINLVTLSQENQILLKVDRDGPVWYLSLGEIDALHVLEYKQSFHI